MNTACTSCMTLHALKRGVNLRSRFMVQKEIFNVTKSTHCRMLSPAPQTSPRRAQGYEVGPTVPHLFHTIKQENIADLHVFNFHRLFVSSPAFLGDLQCAATDLLRIAVCFPRHCPCHHLWLDLRSKNYKKTQHVIVLFWGFFSGQEKNLQEVHFYNTAHRPLFIVVVVVCFFNHLFLFVFIIILFTSHGYQRTLNMIDLFFSKSAAGTPERLSPLTEKKEQ